MTERDSERENGNEREIQKGIKERGRNERGNRVSERKERDKGNVRQRHKGRRDRDRK